MATLKRSAAIIVIGLAITGLLGSGTAVAGASGGMAEPAPAVGSTALPVPATSASPVLGRLRQSLAAQVGVAPTSVRCWTDVSINADANGRWVSAEVSAPGDDKGMLRARATAIGPWEKFSACRDDYSGLTDIASLQNGLAVSAEVSALGDRKGMLRARTPVDQIGPWEWFYTSAPPERRWTTIRSDADVRSLYVSAEIAYPGDHMGMLRARASQAGPWESFLWIGTPYNG
jgi:hypothetical protein